MSRSRTTVRLRMVSSARIVCAVLLVTIGVSTAACALAGRNRSVAEPMKGRTTENLSPEAAAVRSVSELICQGKFDEAGEAVKKAGKGPAKDSQLIARLSEIVAEHATIVEHRRIGRAEAYQEQLTVLDKAQGKIDVNDPNEIKDLSDVNDVVAVLAVVARAAEYADGKQREELLSMPYVKDAFIRAIDNASGFEAEGKWLEAYTNCYYWLGAIDPNNKGYSDYADQLIEQSGIVAAFQDSPCETSKERFTGIKKVMFIRAIAALNLYYVSIIDYGEMATKGIGRCELLTDVVEKSEQFEQFMSDSNDANSVDGESKKNSFTKPDAKRLAAWRGALKGLSDEVNNAPAGFGRDEFLETFEKVLILNSATAELPETIVIAQFAEAALSALDPYTVMVWPRQVEDFEKMMMNEFTGIGVEISKRQGSLTVASLLPDTPAYRSGLDAGDVISGVDGLETKGMTLNCAVKKITGPKGTKVTLTIDREGVDDSQEITITRDRITVPTIRGWQRSESGTWRYLLDEDDKIGYARMMSFSAETSDDFETALIQLEEAGMKALILDLRWNSGGLLDTAVSVSDKFISDGLIVKTQPGFGRVPDYKTATKKTHPDYPLVILINSNSASASEIVAGALADKRYERATLVGDRTHGKGSVQGITHFPGGRAQLKYTMAYYHLPSGQRVESRDAMEKLGRDDWGVGPDVAVKLRSDELRDMIDVQRDNDVLVQANHDSKVNGEVKKHSVEETLKSDPQMALGLLVARAKLIEAEAVK